MSKPNNTIIETTAISYLKLALNRCRMLKPNICENDKSVSWDGDVEVYSSEEFKKETLRGVVPVQIKGKWYDNIPEADIIKYQANVNDLKNYQKDGGTIFFEICCNESEHAIYYSSLLPFDLEKILKNIQTDTKTISLQRLNIDINDIYGPFSDFIYHKKKQNQIDSKIIEMFAKNQLDLAGKNLSFGYGGLPNNSEAERIDYMLSHPAYIYIKPTGFDIDVVLGKTYVDKVGKTIQAPIIYENQLLFSDFEEVYSRTNKDTKIIRLGENIILDSKDEKVSLTFSNNLKERIRDMKFVLWCAQKNKDTQFILTLSDGAQLTEKDVKDAVEYYEQIQKALDAYDVKTELDVSKISDGDHKRIQAFIDSSLYQKEIPYSINGNPGVGIFEFANISLLVCCIESERPNMFFMKNMFELDSIGIHYEIVDSEDKIWMSPYLEFTADKFAKIDNFNSGVVKESIVKFIPDNKYLGFYKGAINKCSLELIGAYDICKRNELLDLADELLEILLKDEEDEYSKAIYYINKLQINIRKGKWLTTKELTETIKYKLKFADNYTFSLCCNIILKEYDDAQKIYNKLDTDQKKAFDEFPINILWEKS